MKPFNLLIFIDDDEATNYYNRYIIEEINISKECRFFQKAEEALEYFKNLNDPTLIPDVLFLDINMPRMNGWNFLEKFKELKMEKTPRVVMLSTSISPKEHSRAREDEMIYKFINKPLTQEALVDLNGEILAA